MIQEFHISITPVAGQDTYLLRTEAVAAGVPLAETQVTWPVADWLTQAEALLKDPLHQLLSGAPSPDGLPQGVASEAAVRLGQDLYQHLFQGRMRDSWLAAQGVAQHLQQPLRLRLGFKDSRLQGLPWELLHGEDRPLATGMDITLCRYYQGPNTVDLAALPPLAPDSEPLRVLMVVSAPSDQHRLALSREMKALMANLQAAPSRLGPASHPSARLRQPLDIHITLLEQPGRTELVQALEQGNVQVLHYAGHSDASFDNGPSDGSGGDLFLVNRHNGLTESLSGKELAGLLVNNGIWLAVFNSCRGAYTPNTDVTSDWRLQNLVQALVTRGVPGVIAMADRIPDDVAITFTQLLYRNLRQGYPADVCLSRVRQGLMTAHGSRQPVWMLPILYLRPGFDGYLFALSTAPNPPTPLTLAETALDPSLIPPDYSADPDISSLAQEVFSGHAALIPPAATAAMVGDWLEEVDRPPAPEEDPVAHLVQQLTAPAFSASPDLSSPDLPDPDPPDPDPPDPPPPSNTAPAAPPRRIVVGGGSAPAPPPPTPWYRAMAQKAAPIRRALATVPAPWRWRAAGVVALGAALALGLSLRPDPPPDPGLSANDGLVPPLGEGPIRPPEGPLSGSGNGVVVINAIQALTTDRPALARRFLEQLLDQRDLNAAQSVLAAADPDQLLDADLAFVRGRLLWQQATIGDQGATPYDARRAWGQALQDREDFAAAWVALGFAHYVLADNDQAIDAWETALRLDQAQLRDRNPDGPPQVADAFTTNALAGLTMAYARQGEQSLDPSERQAAFHRANDYLLMGVNLDPTILDPRVLGLRWLWTPALIDTWRTTVGRLATLSPD